MNGMRPGNFINSQKRCKMHLPYKFKKLQVSIDCARILEEINSLDGRAWSRQEFHKTGHDVIPLISTNGTLLDDTGGQNNSLLPPFIPTEHLLKLPYTREVVYSFGVPPHRTRFASIPPNHKITPHRDLQPNWHNKVRLHIPIVTDPKVLVHIWETSNVLRPEDRTDVHMEAGHPWVFDIWRVHAVTNFSNINRIHLIIDLEPRGKLFDLMFDDIDPILVKEVFSYKYPSEYETDLETFTWLTGGKIDTGKALWNAKITEKNPQVGRYHHQKEFWLS
ncbi:aspartyl/asparaginyl beta-hydroxylase domain-containing protein [Azospirillum sp. TSH100]|nr:aspartyl/asparaginyl beta-hydroxylase domain-containing protein [Azospirillum sp. TSH100]